MKIIRYFRRVEKVARLPHQLVTPWRPDQLTDDDQLVMMAAKARDWHEAQRLYKKYKVSSARELLPLIPKWKPRPLIDRILDWLRRLEGSTAHDPTRHEIKLLRPRQARGGIAQTRLD